MRTGIIIALCVILEHVSRFFFAGTLSYNAGAAFGIFGSSPVFTLILSGIACIILLCVLFMDINIIMRTGLAIMFGGALSNLIERILLGYVIDWIPFPFSFIDLNFNLADVEISLGAFIAFLSCI